MRTGLELLGAAAAAVHVDDFDVEALSSIEADRPLPSIRPDTVLTRLGDCRPLKRVTYQLRPWGATHPISNKRQHGKPVAQSVSIFIAMAAHGFLRPSRKAVSSTGQRCCFVLGGPRQVGLLPQRLVIGGGLRACVMTGVSRAAA